MGAVVERMKGAWRHSRGVGLVDGCFWTLSFFLFGDRWPSEGTSAWRFEDGYSSYVYILLLFT